MHYQLQGMDCASCVAKIETALDHMDGVSDIHVNLGTQRLDLTIAPDAKTQSQDIEQTIKSLGFSITPIHSSSNAAQNIGESSLPRQCWWQSAKGKQVLFLATLMGGAYIAASLLPEYGAWVFIAAVLLGVFPFVKKSIALAKTGSIFTIELLMSVAAIGALFIGEMEEAAAVVFLFSLGELLESVAAQRARAGITALSSLLPKTAIVIDGENKQREIPAQALQIDDVVLIRLGDKAPADGVIVQGQSSFDESPITGESMPVYKARGDKVFAGSINLGEVLRVRVQTTTADNTISRIITLVENAQAAKAPIGRFIERFSRYYTPVVMLIAALVMILPPLLIQGEWSTWVYRGLALLLIACPCALVLSTPAAIASGLAVGTRRGLLIKGGGALEAVGQIKTIAFDKTGTLTEGKPRVSDVISYTGSIEKGREHVLSLFASVEAHSNHPLASAIIEYAKGMNLTIPNAYDAYTTPGKAVHATVKGQQLTIASPSYTIDRISLIDQQQAQINTLQNQGKTVSILFDEQSREALGVIALRDELRGDAQHGVAELKKMGVSCIMMTGDHRVSAQALADELGIAWQAELLPEDKLRLLNDLKQEGKIAMVGDGINDAPALATADVGIAIGAGTDVALETADIALLQNNVTDVAHVVALSRATMANIMQNVAFALGLKGLFLITTLLGLTGLWIAVLADTGGTVLVTINALRLLRFKGVNQ